ncbi:hypothetical protein [Massilia sp. BKSP1R2A-1]|uniref:hypothetical protein n=1 Tax=Massilia sp. BKSP1R2A-1 TaxID=3422595 RepID=UPI003D3564F8
MTAPACFISPLLITAAMITSTSAVTKLPGESDWVATGDYALGQVVYRPSLGRRFENLKPGVNSSPPEDALDRWYDLGTTSKMSMFDDSPGTQSISPNTLTQVFRPGAFNAMYLAGLDGQTLSVIVKDQPGGTIIFEYQGSLEKSEASDWWEHFFSPLRPRTEFTATEITPYASCEVTITVVNTGGVARIGIVSIGDLVSLVGIAESGARVKARTLSRIDSDSRGRPTKQQGRNARDLTFTVTVPLDMAETIADAVDEVMNVSCAVMATDIDSLRVGRTFGLIGYDLTLRSNDAVFNFSVQGTNV